MLWAGNPVCVVGGSGDDHGLGLRATAGLRAASCSARAALGVPLGRGQVSSMMRS